MGKYLSVDQLEQRSERAVKIGARLAMEEGYPLWHGSFRAVAEMVKRDVGLTFQHHADQIDRQWLSVCVPTTFNKVEQVFQYAEHVQEILARLESTDTDADSLLAMTAYEGAVVLGVAAEYWYEKEMDVAAAYVLRLALLETKARPTKQSQVEMVLAELDLAGRMGWVNMESFLGGIINPEAQAVMDTGKRLVAKVWDEIVPTEAKVLRAFGAGFIYG